MWLMLQQEKPQDYVIATGVCSSLQEYVAGVFQELDLNWNDHVVFNKELQRPSDIDMSFGRANKARKELKWTAKTQLPATISCMVGDELRAQAQ
jgi:GDPmannose 4,6-dehydratase